MHRFGSISYRPSRHYLGATSNHIVPDLPGPDGIQRSNCPEWRVGHRIFENEFEVDRNTFCMPVLIQLLSGRIERVILTAG